jgi:hypothetical protein
MIVYMPRQVNFPLFDRAQGAQGIQRVALVLGIIYLGSYAGPRVTLLRTLPTRTSFVTAFMQGGDACTLSHGTEFEESSA